MWSPSEQRIKKEAKRRSGFYCRMDASVLAGVIFVLLVFFMIVPSRVTRLIEQSPVKLIVSAWATPQRGAVREDALRVAITRDGEVYLGFERVAPESLPMAIQEGVRQGAPRTIYLSIDGRARYGDINPVLDQIQASGVRDVVLLTQPRQN